VAQLKTKTRRSSSSSKSLLSAAAAAATPTVTSHKKQKHGTKTMASFYNVKGRVSAVPHVPSSPSADESKMNLSQGEIPLSPAGLAAFTLYTIPALLYHFLDRLSIIDSLYAAVGIVTTVGVLIPPTSRLMYIFICLLSWMSLGIGSIAISEIADAHTKRIHDAAPQLFGPQQSTSHKLNSHSLEEARLLILTAIPILTLGALFFSWSEGWSFFTSLYFVCTAACGLGFTEGIDLTNTRSRVGFIVFILTSMGVTVSLLGLFGMYVRDLFSKILLRRKRSQHHHLHSHQQQQHPISSQHRDSLVSVQTY
jgi:hypothetical protein